MPSPPPPHIPSQPSLSFPSLVARENLSSDPYLISQMDSDQYVPVYILANCTQFKTITKDHSIIVEALKGQSWRQGLGDWIGI